MKKKQINKAQSFSPPGEKLFFYAKNNFMSKSFSTKIYPDNKGEGYVAD